MKANKFFGIFLIFIGITTLFTGEINFGSIGLKNITGLNLYMLSIPFILLGLYSLYNSIKSKKE
ncbi:hypothetical protein MN086_04900 [Sulfurovum sp. XGS-02]|uniref:hypothetical protein n=1 Tax=Sulfurovum sp. XGS-02 TaxID=2925411 RepID=UPI00204D943C|nr:hypothetical protein [Sulfurovum sp. XGS-02]UPT78489.1 hypothetical protein MN086_04900 [Sulfurovum sp. XGS-02]